MATTASRTAKKTVSVPKKRVRVGVHSAPEIRSYIPTPAVAERYIPRKVWGVWDIKMAERAYKRAQNILLMGDTGAGKTLFGEAVASHWQMPYYTLPCDVALDTTAYFGKMMPTDKVGVFRWNDGPVTEIWRTGGVLNISEGNMMSPKIAAGMYPALDGRRYIPLLGHDGEIVRAHLGTEADKPCWCDLKPAECNKRRVLVIMDLNPNYRGTQELNAAFLNRFRYKIPWNYDAEVEEQLVHSPALRELTRKLRDMESEIRTPVSTNMQMEFVETALDKELGIEFAIQNFASAFRTDERSAVVRLTELAKSDIEKDLRYYERTKNRKKNASVDDDEELEEVEMEFEEDDD